MPVFAHGDDIVSIGDGGNLQWFSQVVGRSFEIKSTTTGHDVGDKKQVTVLNRIITVTTTGFEYEPEFEYEPDMRHAELIVQELDVCHSNSVKTFWSEGLCSSGMDEEVRWRWTSTV